MPWKCLLLTAYNKEAPMEPQGTSQATSVAQDEREWELADEELDRTVEDLAPRFTSRPCSCQRTSVCNCR